MADPAGDLRRRASPPLGSDAHSWRRGVARARGPPAGADTHLRARHSPHPDAGEHPRGALPSHEALRGRRARPGGAPVDAPRLGTARGQDARHPGARRHRPGGGAEGRGIELTVIGTRRDPAPLPHVARVLPPEGAEDVLGAADFVLLLLPATPATRDFMSARRLAGMRPTTWLLNYGRGELVVDAGTGRPRRDDRPHGDRARPDGGERPRVRRGRIPTVRLDHHGRGMSPLRRPGEAQNPHPIGDPAPPGHMPVRCPPSSPASGRDARPVTFPSIRRRRDGTGNVISPPRRSRPHYGLDLRGGDMRSIPSLRRRRMCSEVTGRASLPEASRRGRQRTGSAGAPAGPGHRWGADLCFLGDAAGTCPVRDDPQSNCRNPSSAYPRTLASVWARAVSVSAIISARWGVDQVRVDRRAPARS